MRKRPIRVYADTSVFGGVFDEEFAGPSRQLFEQVRRGRYALVISSTVVGESRDAPDSVREFLAEIRRICEVVDVPEEAVYLQQAYLDAEIVGSRWDVDALHVAVATVLECRLIVSWNFRHIVNFEKIPLYNGVNLANGYGSIAIHSPQEVVTDEDKDV